MRLALSARLLPEMHAAASSSLLEARLTELLMSTLCPCDLGEGVEVVHDVESVEIEMECDVDDDAPGETEADLAADTLPFSLPEEPLGPTELLRDRSAEDLVRTLKFTREPNDLDTTLERARINIDDVGTHQFVRYSAPYERIELQIDPQAFVRATIEEARAQNTP